MDVIVYYWADLVKIRKFETSEIKNFNLYLYVLSLLSR